MWVGAALTMGCRPVTYSKQAKACPKSMLAQLSAVGTKERMERPLGRSAPLYLHFAMEVWTAGSNDISSSMLYIYGGHLQQVVRRDTPTLVGYATARQARLQTPTQQCHSSTFAVVDRPSRPLGDVSVSPRKADIHATKRCTPAIQASRSGRCDINNTQDEG